MASPDAQPPTSFEGFEGFSSEYKHGTVVHARLEHGGQLVLQPPNRGYPAPTGFKTVPAGFGEQRYTVARHHLTGLNRFGQDGAAFPFCLVNLAAWREDPFDLRLAHWFQTEAEAIGQYTAPEPPPQPASQSPAWVATFAGPVEIELRRNGPVRWLMFETRDGKRIRRKDFASPHLDHAKRCAQFFLGDPLHGWHALEEQTNK
jgi:hypothetical protein